MVEREDGPADPDELAELREAYQAARDDHLEGLEARIGAALGQRIRRRRLKGALLVAAGLLLALLLYDNWQQESDRLLARRPRFLLLSEKRFTVRGQEQIRLEPHLLEEQGKVREGDRFQLVFAFQREAYLYVFNIDPESRASCLFPDLYKDLLAGGEREILSNPMPTGKLVEIPPRDLGRSFRFDGTLGREWYVVFASPRPVPELEALRSELRTGHSGGFELKLRALIANFEALSDSFVWQLTLDHRARD